MLQPERPVVKKLVRSWLIQGIGWYALDEVFGRVLLEGGFVLALLLLGYPILLIAAAWLVFHTAAWFLLYGGFLRSWVVLGVPTDVGRLRAFLEHVSAKVRRQPFLRTAFLRGSGARNELGPRSDIDVCMVPEDRVGARARGILFLWSLRVESLLRRKPLEARWIDYEKYIAYHVIEETPVFLKRGARPPAAERLATHGLLIALSGIDGSGKTSAGKELVESLKAQGVDATYFYGHRQPWIKTKAGYQLSLAITFESLWKRIGRTLPDLARHRLPRTAYATATLFDYLYVRAALDRTLRPSRVVVADRYVADVVAYLRSWGPLFVTLEGLFVGLCPQPDLAVLFDVPTATALQRKREWDATKLGVFVREYADLATLLQIQRIDAGGTREDTRARLAAVVREDLGLPV